ncbi:MAG TPA: amino acid amidase [Clostridiaceae bacterium]|nr:amino acid amidase [Clostridiaceae bacterium]
MRVFICADIEGSAGFAHIDEGTLNHPDYAYFREQMTREVSAACSGAIEAGAVDILVRDAHDSTRNIIPRCLPEIVRITRGSPGDIYAMMSGLQETAFDAAIMTGFHSGVSDGGSPVSHTFNRKTDYILLNGTPLSEFQFNAYTAAYLDVPVPFVSGDMSICEYAKSLIPNITTVVTQTGYGGATTSIHPDLAARYIKENVYKALTGDYKSCKAKLPESFTVEICFSRHQDAYFNSFYPGIVQCNSKVLRYVSNDWKDVLCMIHFVLDK